MKKIILALCLLGVASISFAQSNRGKNNIIRQELTPDQLFQKGINYIHMGNSNEALNYFTQAAEKGHAEAQYSLGTWYLNGDGVEQSTAEGVKWLTKAAEQGYCYAQYDLGNYLYGIQDYAQALKWWQKAAEQGDADACFNIATCYEAGLSVQKSVDEAIKWYKKSAALGNETAKEVLSSYGY